MNEASLEQGPPPADEHPIWVVKQNVALEELQSVLNELAEQGYQVHTLTHVNKAAGPQYYSLWESSSRYHVMAFDPTRVMKKHTEAVNALMAQLTAQK